MSTGPPPNARDRGTLPRRAETGRGTGSICFAILRCERAGNPQRTPTYASGCRPVRASSGSQLAPVPLRKLIAHSVLRAGGAPSSVPLEELDDALVLEGSFACPERSQIPYPARARILLPGIQTILPGRQLPDHRSSPRG